MSAITILFASLAIGCGCYWLIVVYHILRTRLMLPTARDGLRLQPSDLHVCVVIPAHNEEGSIAALIHSLRLQDHPAWSAVLAIDRCTDQTVANAKTAIEGDTRIEIFEISSCPENWAGKVHAVWQAVTSSSRAQAADLLLFIDADTEMDPGCLRATTALLAHRGDDLLSLLSTLDVRNWYERLVQSVAGFELTRWYPPIRASRTQRRRPFANGQFLLFRSSAYNAIGGHEAVKDYLLEDLEFARRIHANGLKGSVLFADGMHRCRMYDNWPAFVKGWKRIYTECANRKDRRLDRAALRLIFSTLVLPLISLVTLFLVPWAGLVGVGGYVVALLAIAWGGRTPVTSVLGFPIGALLVGRILHEAARDLRKGVPTQWAGRSYVRERR